jgi:hypothetical protein
MVEKGIRVRERELRRRMEKKRYKSDREIGEG